MEWLLEARSFPGGKLLRRRRRRSRGFWSAFAFCVGIVHADDALLYEQLTQSLAEQWLSGQGRRGASFVGSADKAAEAHPLSEQLSGSADKAAEAHPLFSEIKGRRLKPL